MAQFTASIRIALARIAEVTGPILRPLGQLSRQGLQAAFALLKRTGWRLRISGILLLAYALAFIVADQWFKPTQFGWQGRVARVGFWPARKVKEWLLSGKDAGIDLSLLKVPAIQVHVEEITPRISSVGTIEAFEKVEVNAKSPGRIEAFFAREGDLVRQGQKIVQLERAFLELELRQQQAAHEAAQSEQALIFEKYQNARKAASAKFKEIDKQVTLIKKLRADLDRVRNTYAGKEVLVTEGGISREEFAEMKTEVISREAAYRMAQRDLDIVSVGYRDEDIQLKGLAVPANLDEKRKLLIDLNTAAEKAEVEVARSRVKSADAAMQTTMALLKESTIVSPITGLVASRNKAVGEQVTGGSVATPSQAIMVIVDIRRVYAVMTIKESDLQTVGKGMRMVFTADPYRDLEFNGVVEIINPVIDEKTHTIEVKAVLQNPAEKLRPGMFIRSSIVSGTAERMIALPQSAVLPGEENQAFVFVVRAGEVFKALVQTGRQIEDRVEIKQGLSPGDIVVTEKLSLLRDGMKVTPDLPQQAK